MNRICNLFKINYPVIQGGMVWCAGWKLASAVSNAGGLGLLGAGSMHPEVLLEHIRKMKSATTNTWGINVPLLYPEQEKIMKIIADENVPVVFTSAGSPKKWTGWLKDKGITVAHVVSNSFFAEKCEVAGVDAVVAEGFEAGGHNGRDELTTLALIPQVRKATSLPLIAAGGVGTGAAMLACMVTGAEGVQIGSLFAASEESSAHPAFKNLVTTMGEGETMLALKKLAPVRLVKNHFYNIVNQAEQKGATAETLRELLGKGRAKKGIFEGNLDEGELEIGQISAQIETILPAEKIIQKLIYEFETAKNTIAGENFNFG